MRAVGRGTLWRRAARPPRKAGTGRRRSSSAHRGGPCTSGNATRREDSSRAPGGSRAEVAARRASCVVRGASCVVRRPRVAARQPLGTAGRSLPPCLPTTAARHDSASPHLWRRSRREPPMRGAGHRRRRPPSSGRRTPGRRLSLVAPARWGGFFLATRIRRRPLAAPTACAPRAIRSPRARVTHRPASVATLRRADARTRRSGPRRTVVVLAPPRCGGTRRLRNGVPGSYRRLTSGTGSLTRRAPAAQLNRTRPAPHDHPSLRGDRS